MWDIIKRALTLSATGSIANSAGRTVMTFVIKAEFVRFAKESVFVLDASETILL